jgi:2-dehydropantoate 2-reductase
MVDARIAVVGTGANGSAIAADLVRAGVDVTLIEQWPEHVSAMREHGLRIELPDKEIVTPVRAFNLCEVATLRGPFDIVFLLVKAYDTRWACELVKPLLAPAGLLVGVQNGMTIDAIADIVGVERALGSVIEVGSAMYRPGVVERHTPHELSWFAMGGLVPEVTDRAAPAAAALRNAGTVEVVEDIVAAKWMKLIVNAGELVPSAILGLPLYEASRVPGMRDFMLRASVEALGAAESLGVRPTPIFGQPIPDTADMRDYVQTLTDMVVETFALPHSKTTVLQDWGKGRHSEVEEINGLVVDTLTSAGKAAPANLITSELAHRIESGLLTPGVSNAKVLLDRGRD